MGGARPTPRRRLEQFEHLGRAGRGVVPFHDGYRHPSSRQLGAHALAGKIATGPVDVEQGELEADAAVVVMETVAAPPPLFDEAGGAL